MGVILAFIIVAAVAEFLRRNREFFYSDADEENNRKFLNGENE